MGHAGHFMGGAECRFHLTTYLGNGYLVSTVGEWWPQREIREIHAAALDPKWYEANRHLNGISFDDAYRVQFGFREIWYDRLYETMVFKADSSDECDACPYAMSDVHGLDVKRYKDAGEAQKGHYAMCKRWSKKEVVKDDSRKS